MERLRRPSVAGQFYPADPERLRRGLIECYEHPLGPGRLPKAAGEPIPGRSIPGEPFQRTVGFLVPHAAHTYSGPVAAHAFYRMAELGRPDLAVLLGPNHFELGYPLALSPWEQWDTPLGVLTVETALGDSLAASVRELRPDVEAHRREHSLEVQLPFLIQLYGPSLPILPILMADQSLGASRRLGEALAGLLAGRSAVIIATSDFSHYVTDQKARDEDAYALSAIQALDDEGLARVVAERNLTMCGPGPVQVLLAACRALGSTGARLLAYNTSGETAERSDRVVGFAALETVRH